MSAPRVSTDKHLCLRQTAWRREGTDLAPPCDDINCVNGHFAKQFTIYRPDRVLQASFSLLLC